MLAGIGFGNTGCHLPHGMSYAVSGLVRDYRAPGYVDDKAMVPHGFSVVVNAPSVFRFTAPSCLERHHAAAVAIDGSLLRDRHVRGRLVHLEGQHDALRYPELVRQRRVHAADDQVAVDRSSAGSAHGPVSLSQKSHSLVEAPSVVPTVSSRDRCTGSPVETFRHIDAHCSTYNTCAAGVAVTQCTIESGGHTWPGSTAPTVGGYVSPNLEATDVLWEFFLAHPLP